jgi:hypothetical protein
VPRAVAITMVVGWVLISIKCFLAPGLMARWQVPVDPGWVIVPTLIIATVATILVFTRDWSRGDE